MGDQNQPKNNRAYYLFALKIVGDFGIAIAAPVVIFSLIGQHFDEKYHRTPLFTIIGFVVAAALSARLIYKKAKRYGQEYQNLR